MIMIILDDDTRTNRNIHLIPGVRILCYYYAPRYIQIETMAGHARVYTLASRANLLILLL